MSFRVALTRQAANEIARQYDREVVVVLRVRHGAQDLLGPDDL